MVGEYGGGPFETVKTVLVGLGDKFPFETGRYEAELSGSLGTMVGRLDDHDDSAERNMVGQDGFET